MGRQPRSQRELLPCCVAGRKPGSSLPSGAGGVHGAGEEVVQRRGGGPWTWLACTIARWRRRRDPWMAQNPNRWACARPAPAGTCGSSSRTLSAATWCLAGWRRGAGPSLILPARAAFNMPLVETVVHAWDLGKAIGQHPAFNPLPSISPCGSPGPASLRSGRPAHPSPRPSRWRMICPRPTAWPRSWIVRAVRWSRIRTVLAALQGGIYGRGAAPTP